MPRSAPTITADHVYSRISVFSDTYGLCSCVVDMDPS